MRVAATVVSAWFVFAPSLAAQDDAAPAAFDVTGVVVEAGGTRRVAEAMVEIEELDRRTLTDSAGRFTLADVTPARYTIRVSALGYAELVQVIEVLPGEAWQVGLLPRPVVLEGLTIIADRLESRRRALAYVSRVLEGPDLRLSGAPNAAVLLTQRLGALPVECSIDVPGSPSCLWVRGRERHFRLYVDEIPMPSGLELLDTYVPHQLQRVEFYPSLGQVRLYSQGYLEFLARTGGSLAPLCIVCGGPG